MVKKHSEPDQEQDRLGQTHDREHCDGAHMPGACTPARSQLLDEGLDFVVNHDAELLLRLTDA